MQILLATEFARNAVLSAPSKKIVLSGPSGFLGSRVLEAILRVHALRRQQGEDPGEVILLSSSPGRLMERLYTRHGAEAMKTVRASRVDYYKQHDVDTWIDQLGSLGLEGDQAVFVNLAGVAGPVKGHEDAMMDVNYRAPSAAARACESLGVGHWVQSSTQATNAERAGQVPYSRAKAMADFALSRCKSMPVSVACLGLLYSKADGIIGQERTRGSRLNMIDLALLPLTPIMGSGTAPLQPQEVCDASARIAFLALTDPKDRPVQFYDKGTSHRNRVPQALVSGFDGTYEINSPPSSFIYYDAVGPETMSILEMLRIFARTQGNNAFRPVFIGYRNMEKLLNVRSLGNLNRQFVSLLRSEQDARNPIIGDPSAWEKILGPDARLQRLESALLQQNEDKLQHRRKRRFPFGSLLQIVLQNPKIIVPGAALSLEIIDSFVSNYLLNLHAEYQNNHRS